VVRVTDLDPQIRAELERRGPANVREALRRTAAGRFVELRVWFRPPLKIRQATVEDWLREKERGEEGVTYEILKWAKIAGVAAIIGVVIGLAAIVVTLWTAGKL
jgi:predicted transcriptional regulator